MERKLSDVSFGNTPGTNNDEVRIRVGICAMNKKVSRIFPFKSLKIN